MKNWKFPLLPTTSVEFCFIQKLRSAGNEYATLLLAKHSFLFQDNYESIQTLSERASCSYIDLAQYIHGVALLSLGEHSQGQAVLSSLLEKVHACPQGYYAWKKLRYQIMLLLGDRNLHKVPQAMLCSLVGPGHLNPSVSVANIFDVELTCAKCVAYVETKIL